MNSIAAGSVIIQTSSQSVPSTPSWFGEVVLVAQHLRQQGTLAAIGERVRFARRRFGHYDVLDFVAVLFGYAISGERTLEAFYQRLQPFAPAFMALFGRERLPARSTLSRFLASLTPTAVEALRTLFLDDLLARPLNNTRQTGELVGSSRQRASRLRHRWHARGRPPARLARDPGTACPPASVGGAVCARCSRAQAWGDRAHPHHCLTSAYLAVARLVRQPWQWALPGRTAPGGDRHWALQQGP